MTVKQQLEKILSAAKYNAPTIGASIACAGCVYVIFYFTNRYAIFFCSAILGLFLFYIRERQRIIYAIAEISFSLFLLYDASGKGRGGFSSGFSNGFAKYQWTFILLQTGAGIYTLVRGLDNLRQGYREAKELQKRQV